jgi:hypothetical protein
MAAGVDSGDFFRLRHADTHTNANSYADTDTDPHANSHANSHTDSHTDSDRALPAGGLNDQCGECALLQGV